MESTKQTKVLCIDPSICKLGFAVLETSKRIVVSGTYKTKAIEEARYEEVAFFVRNLVEEYNPKYLAIETQYLTGLMSNSILKTCEIKGVCRAAFLLNVFGGIVYDIAPAEVKKYLGISGKREVVKKKTIEIVQKSFFADRKIDDNEADAIVLGLVLVQKLEGKNL